MPALTAAYVFRGAASPDRVASLNLNREMHRTKRLQEVPRIKDFTGSEYTSPLAPHADDALSGFHHEGRSKRVDVSPLRHCTTFLASHAGYYFNEESLR